MKISYLWLKDFIKVNLSIEKLTKYLTSLGLEVSLVEPINLKIKENLDGIVIGKIISIKDCFNIVNIKQVNVKISNNKIIELYSKASNIILDSKIAVAQSNTYLFYKNSFLNIQRFGVPPKNIHGILCSEFDLGISKDMFKLKIFDSSLEVGSLINDSMYLEEDFIFNIEITPNRADAISHFGVARDLYAILSYNNEKNQFIKPNYKKNVFSRLNDSSVIVKIENEDVCQRYSAVLLNHITIVESPIWLKNRLRSIGVKSINNVIDSCNYVMYDLGQPLEVFDFKDINNIIKIGYCNSNTNFIGIDGIKRKLLSTDLIIKNRDNFPLSIAGILGSKKYQINLNTKSIFLHAAYFNPISIRKTKKYHGIYTDSSFRFERGVDPNLTLFALQLVVDLIYQTCYNSRIIFFIDKYPTPIRNKKILFRYNKINDILGYVINPDKIKKIFSLLNIHILVDSNDRLEVEVDSYRNDITREIDLIEEILRIYGYDNIPISNKIEFSRKSFYLDQFWKLEMRLANYLVCNGFYEVINNSLVSIDKVITNRVELLNPLSKELGMLRNNLTINLLNNISFNLSRQLFSIKFFEFGKIYLKNKVELIEKNILSLVICGKLNYKNWVTSDRQVTFFDLRGIIEEILDFLGIEDYSENYFSNNIYEEGIQLLKNNLVIVELGLLHKNLCIRKYIKYSVYSSDLYLDVIEKLLIKNKKIIKFSKFPISKRDLSLIINKKITYYQIKKIILSTHNKLLKKMQLIDVYNGNSIPYDKKSYTISLYIQDDTKNLTDEEIDDCVKTIFTIVSKETQATLRNEEFNNIL